MTYDEEDECLLNVIMSDRERTHFLHEAKDILLYFASQDVTYGDVLSVCEVIAPSGYHRSEECQIIEVKSQEQMLQVWFENERIKIYDEVPAMGID